jgi:hypothetical protein
MSVKEVSSHPLFLLKEGMSFGDWVITKGFETEPQIPTEITILNLKTYEVKVISNEQLRADYVYQPSVEYLVDILTEKYRDISLVRQKNGWLIWLGGSVFKASNKNLTEALIEVILQRVWWKYIKVMS